MVLRKPYALLIKYFKLIHVIFACLLIYVAVKSNNIIDFFNEFIKSGYRVNQINAAGSYVNFLIYLSVLLILGISITIYFLMRKKEKPTKLYVFTIIYYTFMFIMFTVIYSAIARFEVELIEATTARAYRDISIIILIPQFVFIILGVIRAIGFDLKKFNFNQDLHELKVETRDNEEFEVAVDRENYKIKRSLRKNYREFKYYLIEHKFILISISVIISVVILTSVYFNVAVYNRRFQIDQTFISNNMKNKVTNSYLTNLSYNGEKLAKNKYYLVVDFIFENLLSTKNTIELENYRLLIDDKVIVPTINRNEHFIDLGIPYKKEKLEPNSTNHRLLIYEIDEKDIKESYTIKIKNAIDVSSGIIQARYSQAVITPKVLDKIAQKKEVNLNEELTFNDSLLDDSKVIIKNYNINRNYKYNYEFCFKDECNNSTAVVAPTLAEYDQTLLILNGDIKFNEESLIYKKAKSKEKLNSMFGKIIYTQNNEIKTTLVKDITPKNLSNVVVLQAYNGIEGAEKISLVFTFRNEEYIIKLK